jgi:threonine dehydrogenase-like Zn-dependent dehydrogenase
MVRVGIVGCGFVANYHVNAWRGVGAEVVAVCDVIEEKARGFARSARVIVSRDLRYWYKLHLGGGSGYNHFVEVAAQGDRVFVATGSELLVFTLKDFEAALAGEPFLRPYGARLDRVRGALFFLKRLARPVRVPVFSKLF